MNIKRNTPQRQIILDTIKSLNAHPTAEELYAEISKNHHTVGKSTVYRNLRKLVDDNVIAQIVTDDAIRYDKSAIVHYHFICDSCGTIFDLELDRDDSLNDAVKAKHGFNVTGHKLEFFGTCADCTTEH